MSLSIVIGIVTNILITTITIIMRILATTTASVRVVAVAVVFLVAAIVAVVLQIETQILARTQFVRSLHECRIQRRSCGTARPTPKSC